MLMANELPTELFLLRRQLELLEEILRVTAHEGRALQTRDVARMARAAKVKASCLERLAAIHTQLAPLARHNEQHAPHTVRAGDGRQDAPGAERRQASDYRRRIQVAASQIRDLNQQILRQIEGADKFFRAMVCGLKQFRGAAIGYTRAAGADATMMDNMMLNTTK